MSDFIVSDHEYMQRAISLAKKGRWTTTPNPNVGCVIVQQGHIVGEGFHAKAGQPHAEVMALRQAGAQAKGATAYVTLEPCCHFGRTPPCADTLVAAGISRVVIAMRDPNPIVAGKGIARLREAGVEVIDGVLTEQAEALNLGFLKRMRTGLPYVQLKLAASLDGKTAMASGESQWITSEAARQDVQAFRAESSAILSTSQTVIQDDPSLTVRWAQLPESIQLEYPEPLLRQPIRVVIDSQSRVDSHYRIFNQPGETWLVRRQSNVADPQPEGAHILTIDSEDQIALPALMQALGKQGINTVWVEAGAHLAGALIQANLVDELILYLAPKLLGQDAKGLCLLNHVTKLSHAPEFILKEVTQIGDDVRLRLVPKA